MKLLLAFLPLFFVNIALADVFDKPCNDYGIQKEIVLAIAMQESSMRPWCVNIAGKDYYAKNKAEALSLALAAKKYGLSYDLGLMQINNQWLAKLEINENDALEPINNVAIGCYILAKEIQRHGWSWQAVGAYHSPVPWRQQDYAYKVNKIYNQILGRKQ